MQEVSKDQNQHSTQCPMPCLVSFNVLSQANLKTKKKRSLGLFLLVSKLSVALWRRGEKGGRARSLDGALPHRRIKNQSISILHPG